MKTVIFILFMGVAYDAIFGMVDVFGLAGYMGTIVGLIAVGLFLLAKNFLRK